MSGNAWGESWGLTGDDAWGDSWGFEGFAPPVVTPPTILPAGTSYLAWWQREWDRIRGERKKKKKKLPPKKLELIKELDQAVIELQAQLAERQDTEAYTQTMQREVLDAAALINQAYADLVSAQRLRLEITRFEEYLREMDDEETILLALH
ncbi:MAG: hypothetical protein ACREUA_07375 [Burkholderiales bacterium]